MSSQPPVSESEDGAWEDLHDPSEQPPTPPISESHHSSCTSPRRRKTGGRTVYVVTAGTARKQYVLPASPPANTRRATRPIVFPSPSPSPPVQTSQSQATAKPHYEPIITREELVHGLIQGLAFAARYSLDVLRRAIGLLKHPLSVIISLWLLAFLVARLSYVLRSAFSPLCLVPGISGIALCRPVDPSGGHGGSKNGPRWADYPRMVDVQSTTFDQLLGRTAGTAGLPLEIKKAEMATADLVTLVRVSDLRSRDVLAETLVRFVEDARKTGRGLQKLNSKIGGAVDGIMAVNDYALQTIEEAVAKRAAWNPFALLLPWKSAPSDTNEVVTATFTETMNLLAHEMQRLIIEAEVSLGNLDNLEEGLKTLQELVVREDVSLSAVKNELLAELWTILGGNKRALRGLDNHLSLLQNLGAYRHRARAHVVASLDTLQKMSADMEDLRERVAAPELTGGRIPVEVHMKSIRSGLERLKESRVKARGEEQEAVQRVLSMHSE